MKSFEQKTSLELIVVKVIRATRLAAALACMVLLLAGECGAQQTVSSAGDTKGPDQSSEGPSKILGARPYLATENTQPFEPLTAKRKLYLALKESVDWPRFIFNGATATLYYVQRQNPSFGTGPAGYGKQYVAATADSAVGSMLTDGVFPAVLREDPRHVQRGSGSVLSRLGFALRQTLVTRTDSGDWRFASSKWLGTGTAIAISNVYSHSSQALSANGEKFALQLGGTTVTNVFEEFWPGLKRRLFSHHHN